MNYRAMKEYERGELKLARIDESQSIDRPENWFFILASQKGEKSPHEALPFLGKKSVPTGIRTRVEGCLREKAPQASGMSTTPSGQNIPHGMLLVIKPVGLKPWSGRFLSRAENQSFEIQASRVRKSMRRTHCRWPARAGNWRCGSLRPS